MSALAPHAFLTEESHWLADAGHDIRQYSAACLPVDGPCSMPLQRPAVHNAIAPTIMPNHPAKLGLMGLLPSGDPPTCVVALLVQLLRQFMRFSRLLLQYLYLRLQLGHRLWVAGLDGDKLQPSPGAGRNQWG
jgi:hypothetical protein